MLHVTLPQVSELAAPPLEANQAFRAAVLPAPSHSTVRSAAAVSIEGGVVSSIVIVWSAEEILPQSSVAVHVLVMVCVFPQFVTTLSL